MKHILIAGCLLSTLTVSAGYTGRVFIDTNRNGIYDKGEKTLASVCVSDGKNVVKTDKHGRYILPGHEKERFIFITTPSGYKTDNAYYRRIQTDKTEYDFGVVPYNAHIGKGGTHRFVQISDTEIREIVEHDDWVQNVRSYAANENVAFVVHTGDICYEAGLNNHIKLMNTANMNTQMFYCIGNHDLVKGAYGEEVFEKNYGPVYYSFDVGSVHYIVTPMPRGDYAPSYTKEDVYEWLKNDLAQIPDGKPIMIFNHDVLTYDDEFKFYKNKDEFIDLDAHNLKAWIYGHRHINHIRKHKQAYSICTSTPIRGGIDHASSAFRVYNVDAKGNFKTELRYTYFDKHIAIASLDNLQASVSSEGKMPLSVNTYSTVSPTESVTYNYSVEDKLYTLNRKLEQKTDFNWVTEVSLPESALGKMVTVSVKAEYKNGEVAKTEHSFIYKGDTAPEIDVKGRVWDNLLGNARHIGVSSDSISGTLRLKWFNNIGSNIYMVSPLLENDRLFVASIDEDNKGRASVAALDAKSGKLIWKSSVDGSIKNSIALSAGKVLAQDIYGNLYAFSQNDGRLVWKKDLNSNSITALNDGLVAEGNIVYAGTGKSLCAVDVNTGNKIWQNKGWNSREGCTATLSVGPDFVIGHSHWGALYANDKSTGKYLWGESKDGLRNRSAAPAVYGNLLYLASKESFFIIDGNTGKVIVRKDLHTNVDVASTPLVTDSEIIFGTAENGLMALDKESLEKKWEFHTGPSLIYSSPYVRNPSCTVETSPVLSGDVVFFAASDGLIYGVNRKDGRLLWKHDTGAPVLASVCVAGNALFAVDFAGNVYGFVTNEQ